MNSNYTQEASGRCFDLFDSEADGMWERFAEGMDQGNKEKWAEMLGGIAKEFLIGSRFALMRLCQKWACGDDEADEFCVAVGDEQLTFRDITIDHAQDLSKAELADYEKLLAERASMQADYDPDAVRKLLKKALGAGGKDVLTRDEALQIGHMLDLTLDEAQWLLTRTLDMGEGFRYNCSEDLIEAYGFLTRASSQHVDELKRIYVEQTKGTVKADPSGKPVDWTRDACGSLPEMAAAWNEADRDRMFMDWMIAQAAYLDTPSKTAARIYRDLAVYARNMIIGEESAPADSDFVLVVRQIVSAETEDDRTVDQLWSNGELSAKACKDLAGMLLLENLNFSLSDQTDKSKAWHYLKMKNGKLTASGGIDGSRKRVEELLNGTAMIEKADMLYMLWFLANMCWFENERELNADDVFNRLADFIDAAEICLDEAMLAGFYPPHALEQSLLLSIVYGGAEGRDPAEVYEEICSSVIQQRERRAKAK